MNRIADSFAWPFRGHWPGRWAIGLLAILLPLGFIPLLGYAVAAVRSADDDGPPAWRRPGRLLLDGALVAVAIAILTLPFGVIAFAVAPLLANPDLWRSSGTLLRVEAWSSAILALALPWGIVVLLLMPHATARYAATGREVDLFNFASSLRSVRHDFAAWNVAVAAIVTAWAVGLACSALLCVGVVPGMFYAILVSAHATAALHPESKDQPAR